MVGFKLLRSLINDIKTARDGVEGLKSGVEGLKSGVEGLKSVNASYSQSLVALSNELQSIHDRIEDIQSQIRPLRPAIGDASPDLLSEFAIRSQSIERQLELLTPAIGAAIRDRVSQLASAFQGRMENIEHQVESSTSSLDGLLREQVSKMENIEHQVESSTSRLYDLFSDQFSRLKSDLRHTLDIAVNEIEFIRRRTNAYIGNQTSLAFLSDQTPIFIDPSDPGPATNILNGGLYEVDNLDVILSFVRPDTTFLDLGANVGIFSLQVGRRVLAAGKVHAFEPQTLLINLLRRSAFLNGLGDLGGRGIINSYAVGASDLNGKVGFVVPLGHLGGGRVTEHGQTNTIISVVRLDDFLGPDFQCDLVKIDVEGHEFAALRGMRRILANSSRVKVLFENFIQTPESHNKVEEFLAELDFKLYGVATNAILVPLATNGLAKWNGYVLAAKIGDPELEELNRRRFFIYPRQLAVQSAVIENGLLQSRAAPGQIAFHGPYWFLPRGQYRMQLHGELRGSLAITIATRFGYPLTAFRIAEGGASGDFTIERDAVLFECVARPETADTELSLQRIEIVHL